MNEDLVLGGIIEKRRGALVELVRDLLTAPSENPPGNEYRVVEAIQRLLDRYSFTNVKVLGRAPERPNLVITLKGQGRGRRLLYNGHLDVVPVGEDERAHWKADPYSGEVIDGEIFGRGAADMKGPIASMLLAAVALKEAGAPFNGELILAFTSEEETGGYYGAQYVSEQGLASADAGVIGEPSGMEAGFDYLATACRGYCCFKLVARGTQMHSSQSDIRSAVNANLKLAYALSYLSKHLKLRYQPHPFYPQGPTINLANTISGGVDYCIVPGYAEARNDIRTLPGMTREHLIEDIESELASLRKKDPKIDIQLVVEEGNLGWASAAEVAPDHEIVRVLGDATEKVLGYRPKVGGFTGGTDAQHFINIGGTPTVSAFGPGLLKLAHGPNERVSLEDLVNGAKIYALAAMRYLS